ncbi:MAG: Lactyl (2) diphospho-(5')guanosine:7,8-didemethyl-8-hydroxy-5-deazariboflavin 2-phospho-L-lactate transferase [uncultured Thermomicrobiales bacterium]|uniref:Lactyl (2) diphospho-(5')guanosine:7,8-didemethyl-8-hydroxy-5-deazarib oflavin 2-phospho-L-lactate transferase n=1 Tax=uncultured Thermomicrobiales bacterium TaxID=1645740 RepID=A0A6J4VE88_9BACT|nr:MAG: Lactyl (2) diphospho-(5')guanosine:7,8-didemethyl-8-hydroxy-5-deazariboflavin 2-phospho-L-lactate transferase [uncultured Thermomicrobiales bacterium]
MSLTQRERSVTALAGGVGGAKLAQGLADVVPPSSLSIVVNTADDFDLWGLRICPDLDTVMYTLAGLANPATGWGIAGDSSATLDAIARYGEAPWFQLGDQDFATHILRSEALRSGATLTEVTGKLSHNLGVASSILPMTDDIVSTMIRTPETVLAFQDYFVRRRQVDTVTGVTFAGIENASMSAVALAAIDSAGVIVFCPSNPLVSIGPILSLPGVRDRVRKAPGLRVGVSPIIGGKAIKGPADRMLESLGHESSAYGVAHLYADLLDVFVIDTRDEFDRARIEDLGMRVVVTDAVMGDRGDRARLAGEVLDAAGMAREAVS